MWDSNDLDQVAATLSHELGHNLGLDHDTAACSRECPGPGGCLMSPAALASKSSLWSSCSRDYLRTAYRRGMDYCLRNVPQQVAGYYISDVDDLFRYSPGPCVAMGSLSPGRTVTVGCWVTVPTPAASQRPAA